MFDPLGLYDDTETMPCDFCGKDFTERYAQAHRGTFYGHSSRSRHFCSWECEHEFKRQRARGYYQNWKVTGGLDRLRARRQQQATVPARQPAYQLLACSSATGTKWPA